MSYRHGFLLATPAHNEDSPMHKAVIYMCEHAPGGSLGLLLNKELDLSLADILKKKTSRLKEIPISYGGSEQTQERGFVLHEPLGDFWIGTTELSTDLHMTTTNDILHHLPQAKKDRQYRIFVGYTSWSAYHLDYEVAHDLWFFLPYQPELLWDSPPDLWQRCYEALGIQPSNVGCIDQGVAYPH